MTDAGEAIQYLRWRKDVADHDYAAASSYLSIRSSSWARRRLLPGLLRIGVGNARGDDAPLVDFFR